MNKRFLVAAAFAAVAFTSGAYAADLPRKMPVKAVPVAAPFSWTGFYVGAHGGGGWGDTDLQNFADPTPINAGNNVPGPDANYKMRGGLAGGQIGYNWQTGWTVLGVEADASWTDIKGSGANAPFAFAGQPALAPICMQVANCSSKIEALGTITGRVGAAIDNTLVYVKGGGAWMQEKHTVSGIGIDVNFNDVGIIASTSETRWGWTVGAGLEYAFASNWSVKFEYNYIDFGTERVNFVYVPAQAFAASAEFAQTLQVAKAGINYRF